MNKGKTPSESKIEMTQLVLPNDTNLLGNLLGGRLMHWIDIAGAMAASRHSNKVVATVSLDGLDFRHPIRMGELVILKARLIWTGKTSMEAIVKVYAENLKTGNTILTNKAHITYVALDKNESPVEVPSLILNDKKDIEKYNKAQARYENRKNKI